VWLQVGLLDEERILPVGQEITAVGILDALPDGKPVIKPCCRLPIFLYDQQLAANYVNFVLMIQTNYLIKV
jgi:hypothetical protein